MSNYMGSFEAEYPKFRSNYIEENLLKPWCYLHKNSQIILLGAGLDTRAYRFAPLKINVHMIFEIDFPYVISHKEVLMRDKLPLCDVVRLSADLVKPDWSFQLLENGFCVDIPTFWILEGLVYYMERKDLYSLISKAATISSDDSQIFMDVIHALRLFRFSYTQEDSIDAIESFFESTGWNVSCKLADDYVPYQNLRQKKKFLIYGQRTKTLSTAPRI